MSCQSLSADPYFQTVSKSLSKLKDLGSSYEMILMSLLTVLFFDWNIIIIKNKLILYKYLWLWLKCQLYTLWLNNVKPNSLFDSFYLIFEWIINKV